MDSEYLLIKFEAILKKTVRIVCLQLLMHTNYFYCVYTVLKLALKRDFIQLLKQMATCCLRMCLYDVGLFNQLWFVWLMDIIY